MLGCHNCERRPKPGTPYETTPCATCRMGENPPPVSHYAHDPATYQVLRVYHPSMQGNGEIHLEADGTYTTSKPLTIRNLLKALAHSVRILVDLKERHPTTYRILDAKMQDPNLSYADLANRFSCRKQNIQYHLKKAVELCPELHTALLIDSRFSLGYSALKNSGEMLCEQNRRARTNPAR